MKYPAYFANHDMVLRDQFIMFVRDGVLWHKLQRQVRLDSMLSFLHVCQKDLHWMEEDESPCVQQPCGHFCRITNIVGLPVQSSAILGKHVDELIEVKVSLHKQQVQVDRFLKSFESSANLLIL